MKRLIVNADDLGLSPGVNRGIAEAFRHGLLTSATMLVNMDSFDDAVAMVRANPDFSVGIHLSLLWGRPVTAAASVPSLVDGQGCFPRSFATLAARHFSGRLAIDEVEREFSSQIRRFLDAGLTPTHADTHKHVHCLPAVMGALARAATALGITKVRLPLELEPSPRRRYPPPCRPSWRGRCKRRLIGHLCRKHRSIFQARGLRTTDHFLGIGHMDRLDGEVLRFLLRNLQSGTTELMCHPGHSDGPCRHWSSEPPHREVELAALVDARSRAEAEALGVELIGYRDL